MTEINTDAQLLKATRVEAELDSENDDQTLRQKVAKVRDYISFSIRLFDETTNPKHLRNCLEQSLHDLSKAMEEYR